MCCSRRSRVGRLVGSLLVLVTLLALVGTVPVRANPISPGFRDLWAQTDQTAGLPPVWGPEAITDDLNEAYVEAAGGYRVVQYFDKGRMELGGTAQNLQITSGLLATELITGKVQTGNATTRYAPPARIPVAGDPTNTW